MGVDLLAMDDNKEICSFLEAKARLLGLTHILFERGKETLAYLRSCLNRATEEEKRRDTQSIQTISASGLYY